MKTANVWAYRYGEDAIYDKFTPPDTVQQYKLQVCVATRRIAMAMACLATALGRSSPTIARSSAAAGRFVSPWPAVWRWAA